MNPIDIFISAVLALIMLGIGATLKLSDFKRIFLRPKALSLGLGLQILFLPALALVLLWFSDLSPEIKMGIFIISICPGGSTSNFISYIVNADVALSISLTALNSIVIVFSIPLLSSFALDYFMDIDHTYSISLWGAVLQVFLIVLVPVCIGLWFNHKYYELSRKIETSVKYINVVLLGSVFLIKFLAGEDSGGTGINKADIISILPMTLLLHATAILISFFLASRLLNKNIQATTIGIEVGLQNTTLAILLAGTIIGSNEMTKPALVYALFSFFTTITFAYLVRRQKGFGKRG